MRVEIPDIPGAQIALPEEFDRLYDIANNIWWAWDDEASELWSRIDAQRWHDVQNPISFLQGVEPSTWESLSADARFLESYDNVVRRFDGYMASDDTWGAKHGEDMTGPVAYLCTEYGLQTKLPFYSGGLGILAGDHIKTASDLGIPMVAVGLLFRRGYFRQAVDPGGGQQHYYPALDLSRRPIHPVVGRGGSQLQVELDFPGRSVMAAVWKVQVGRVPLIMLDTDVPENDPADRTITHHLYVRGRDMRLAQELVLGVGAVKVMRKLGITPGAWHVNEGHAAFSVLERTARRMREGLSFDEAQRQVRAKTLFTLHTPVPAGNERFDLGAVLRYTDYLFPEVDAAQVAKLGRTNDHDDGAFDMGALAIRFASFVNGVSQRHGEVATEQWSHLIGGPAAGVTNGVHVPTWVGHSVGRVFTETLGTDWPSQLTSREPWEAIRDVPDDELWHAHLAQKNAMTRQVRRRLRSEFSRHGASPDILREVRGMLPPDRLTIGFARRFATYKRATLLLQDLPRLQAIMTNPERPVQFIFAGKAHPADTGGQDLIRRVVELSQRPEFRGHLFFVEDYDMTVGRLLTGGCDVWLNNPVPPKEASGTSGMKSALNGGLNLSVPDGWWAEAAVNGQNGWTFGPDGLEAHGDDSDAAGLYELFENEVVPLFYDRDGDGVPKAWVKMMKEAIVSSVFDFSTHRMLMDYANQAYFPLAAAENQS
jgi:starch phosphorylase